MSKTALLNRLLRPRGMSIVRDDDLDAEVSARHMRALLAKCRIDCVIDVGANLGQFRDFMVKRVGWCGPVLSFEPVSAYYAQLSPRASSSWRIFNYALGSRNEEREITIFDSPGLASIRAPDLDAMKQLLPRHSVEVEKTELIRTRRLADVFADVTKGFPAERILLKIDTQGYDLEVFRGARPMLPKVAAIQTELSFLPIYADAPGYAETLAEMRASGFEVSGMFPVTLDDALRVIEFDCVLVTS